MGLKRLEQEGAPKSRANAIPLETAMGHLEPTGPENKCQWSPMEQVAAPYQKPMGPLNQGQIRLLGYDRTLELHKTPEDEQEGPFGDLWMPWGSNLEVTGFPVSIWVGPQIKLFFGPKGPPPYLRNQ